MEIKQIRIFLHVCDTLSFTETAKQLNYAQSTISDTIRHLEQDLGKVLFDRMHSKIYLTNSGRILERESRVLINHHDQIIKMMSDQDEIITVGITESLCAYKFPQAFRDFLSSRDKLSIDFIIVRCEAIVDALKDHTIDIGFTIDEKLEDKFIQAESLFQEEIAFVKSADYDDHPYQSYKDFESRKLIISKGNTGYNQMLEERFERANISVKRRMYMESIEAIKGYVRDGFGFSFMPKVTVEKELASGDMTQIIIDDEHFYHDVQIAIHKDKHVTDHLRDMIDYFIRKYRKPL